MVIFVNSGTIFEVVSVFILYAAEFTIEVGIS